MAKIEDNKNGRQQNGRRPKWKIIKIEEAQDGRWPKWKMTNMEDNQNGR